MGYFSDDEEVYVQIGVRGYIVDVSSGDLIYRFSKHGPAKVSNKKQSILAVADYRSLFIVNYKTEEVHFVTGFKDEIKKLFITPDGEEVTVTTKKNFYRF